MVVVGICFKTTLNKAFLTCKLFTADMAAQLRCCPVAGIGIHSLTPSSSPLLVHVSWGAEAGNRVGVDSLCGIRRRPLSLPGPC